MALRLPDNLYTAGAVTFDSSPSVNLYNQLLLRKQARDEALNQYFNQLPAKLNTAGVRTQDLSGQQGGINNDIENWRQNWLNNKEAIKKGGAAQQQYMAQYQDILRKIEQSKQRAKTELEIGKLKLENKYNPDDDDIHVLDKIGRSIYDPTSYKEDEVSEYGLGDLSPAVPQFDVNRQNQFWTAATRGLSPNKKYDEANIRRDAITGNAIVPFTESFNDEQIKQIGANARSLIRGDKSAAKYYGKMLSDVDHFGDWQRLNKQYQSVYGDKSFADTPEKLAEADIILRAKQPQKTGEELRLDREAANKNAIDRLKLQDTLIRGRQRASASAQPGTVNDVYGRIEESLNANKGQLNVEGLPYDQQAAIISMVNDVLPSEDKRGASDVYIMKNEKGDIAVYDKYDNTILGYLPKVATNIKAQVDVKGKREVLKDAGNKDVKVPKDIQKTRIKINW